MIEIDALSVRYGRQVPALNSVSIRVDKGEVVCLLGANGAGKSTLLRAISGTLGLHGGCVVHGTIRSDGRDITGKDPADVVRGGVSQVPEGRRIFGRMSVSDNLRAGSLSGRSPTRRSQRTELVYDLFPILRERRDRRAGLLSGGEQQMLAIGRALMSDPSVLLLDEPSLGLAPKIIGQIGEVISHINAGGVSVLLVEQNAAMALRVASRAYVLDTGTVAVNGYTEDLLNNDTLGLLYLGSFRGAGRTT